MMIARPLSAVLALLLGQAQAPPPELPPAAAARLAESLDAARRHGEHVWRDTPPVNADGTVNAYVEIAHGDRRKWEFDMAANGLALDRVMPSGVGGFPVNYGYVPQTVSYDGDPFDALVLGPPLEGGRLVRGVIVGVMFMEDEKGHDSKVVLSPAGPGGGPRLDLSPSDRRAMTGFFNQYKVGEPDAFSRVLGWGSAAEGRAYIDATHAFFRMHADSRRPASRSPRFVPSSDAGSPRGFESSGGES